VSARTTALSRRSFLIGLAAAPVALSAACAGDGVGFATDPARSVAGRGRPLPIPPLATATTDASGVRRFALTAGPGSTEMLAGTRTPTWGYNGSVLGPTIRARRGETVAFTIDNALPEATTVHWHGLHVPARYDGGPHQTIDPGARWEPTWTVNQPAATLWYHPHPHGTTEKHVYRGLAGFFLVDDEDTPSSGLPSTYGVDDIPIVVQDKRFAADGALDESGSTDVGLLGDTVVANGFADTYLPVSTELVRLRLLNGSAGRMYNLGFSDDREFDMVASDGGLLPEPVRLTRIALSPGERAEIVVAAGAAPVLLRAFPFEDNAGLDAPEATDAGVHDDFDILELRPATTLGPSAAIPAALATVPPIDPNAAVARREFELQWFMINGQRMDMARVDFISTVDTVEIWTVRNVDNWPHNFHVHDTQFQILDIDGATPPPELCGWKDTVYTPPGSTIRLALRFSEYTDPALPYMYHCHLLLHEDMGMMGQFLVLGPGEQPLPMAATAMGTGHAASAPTTPGAGHGGH
jgi:blue copper oxidase